MSKAPAVTRSSAAFVPPNSAVSSAGTDKARRRPTKHLLRLAAALSVAAAALMSSGAEADDATPSPSPSSSSTELRDANGNVVGFVAFDPADGGTLVTVWATLPAGSGGIHGFHIHANDNPANGEGCIADPAQPANTHFASADGHYNSSGATHGDHAGDMPALFFTEAGRGSISLLTDRFDTQEIKGKAVILHQGPDNYGNVPVGTATNQYTPNGEAATALTQATGNAGNRIACGVIK